jgi:hypothetical protein
MKGVLSTAYGYLPAYDLVIHTMDITVLLWVARADAG